MLFDLRSRGRRRTVQAIYLSLAILMGGGLVLFGVGTGVGGGGLLNAIGGSSSNQKQVVSQQDKAALAEVKANPNSASAWGNLLQARWTTAGTGNDYNTSTATFTAAGKQELNDAVTAWEHYTSLTKTPDPDLAVLAARAYTALGKYSGAAAAWGVEAQASPTVAKGFECEAVSAYADKQTRLGDLASAKALTLLPKSQQLSIKQSFSEAKSSTTTAAQIAAQC